MRGGVSLAVWIGGACCEIDALRVMPTDPGPANFWRPLAARAPATSGVVVDVLAGASAGGLNGVLYAASQVYGFPTRPDRDTSAEARQHRGPGAPSAAVPVAVPGRRPTSSAS